MSLDCIKAVGQPRLMSYSGHYDLLYKTEDVVEMSIPALANPEIRLVSNNPAFLASENMSFSHNLDLDPMLDIPGFSLGFATSASSAPTPYKSPKEAVPAQKPLSPAPRKEVSPPIASQQPSPPSKALPIQLKIRPHMNQFEFDFERIAAPEAIITRE